MTHDQAWAPFASVQRPRPLPVIVLADVSGSMATEGKIESLNMAIASMLRAFAAEKSARGEVVFAVVTFGGAGAAVHHPPVPAAEVMWTDISVVGGQRGTPLGDALNLAQEILADEEMVPARAFEATLVLISDGRPTGEWQQPLAELLASRRGGQALRLAIAIGSEAGSAAYRVLQAFIDDPLYQVIRAEEADRIPEIFRYLTRSISIRVNSAQPDDTSVFDPDELADLSD